LLLDESSQMIEPASLIPAVRFHAERVLAVGDPQQLPPTLPGTDDVACSSFRQDVDGREELTGLTRTFFERMRDAGADCMTLRTQYRCHEMLSQIPNKLFYDNRLLNGTSADARFPFLIPLPGAVSRPLPPYVFVNVQGRSYGTGSLANEEEVDAMARVAEALLIQGVTPEQIGVIAPYRAQVRRLTERFARINVGARALQPPVTFGGSAQKGKRSAARPTLPRGQVCGASIKVSTVDAFQGAEKDIILLATTRVGSTDFIDNPQRLNVSLTRAKHHMILFGDRVTLIKSPLFLQLVGLASRSPGSFANDVNQLLTSINRLELNPRLLEVKAAADGDAAEADAPMAANLSMRGLAMSFQHQAEQAPQRRAAAASAHAPAEADDDFIDDDEEEQHATNEDDDDAKEEAEEEAEEEESALNLMARFGRRRRSELDLDSMSPYTRNIALHAARNDEEAPRRGQAQEGEPGAAAAAPVNLGDLMERDQERERAERRARETLPRRRRRIDDEDEEEGEATFAPLDSGGVGAAAPVAAVPAGATGIAAMSDKDPSSSADSGEGAQIAPAPATAAALPVVSLRPAVTSLRDALSRSSSSASEGMRSD